MRHQTWGASNLGRFKLTINPDKDSQPRGLKPGPQPGNKKGGMPKGFKFEI